MAAAEIAVIRTCLQTCGINHVNTRIRISDHLFGDFATANSMSESTMRSHLKHMVDHRVQAQRLNLSPIQVDRVVGLLLWLKDQDRINVAPDGANFTLVAMREAISRERIRKNKIARNDDLKPEKFSKEFTEWSKSVETYVNSYVGENGVDLGYLMRPNDAPGDPAADYPDFAAKCVACTRIDDSEAVQTDKKTLYNLIHNLIIGTDAMEAAPRNHETTKNGRALWLAMKNKYHPVISRASKVAEAELIKLNLHYVREDSFPFAKFVTRFERMINLYDQVGEPMAPQAKIRLLIEKCKGAQDLVHVIAKIEADTITGNVTFEQACVRCQTRISAKGKPKSRKVAAAGRDGTRSNNRGGRGGNNRNNNNANGGGRGGGRDSTRGNANNGKRKFKGYEPENYDADDFVPNNVWFKWSDEQKARKGKKKPRTVGSTTTVNLTDDDCRRIAAAFSAQLPPEPEDVERPAGNPPANDDDTPVRNNRGRSGLGGRAAAAAYRRNVSSVSVRPSLARQLTRMHGMVGSVSTIDSAKKVALVATNMEPHKYEPNLDGNNEIDNHADTICVGANWIPLHYTGQVVDVGAYLPSYAPEPNIPIATAATAYDHPVTGDTFVLVVNQALYFGDKMGHTSLLNPNQIRYHGATVRDNPFEGDMYIESGDFKAPMETDGVIIGFKSRTPTEEELMNCPHVVLSSAATWDPRTVRLCAAARRREEDNPKEYMHTRDKFHEPLVPGDTTFDKQEFAARLIARVNVKANSFSEDQARTDIPNAPAFKSGDRKSSVKPEQLCQKLHIGLNTARNMLRVTTQKGIRSGVLPLSRRYRADRWFGRKTLNTTVATDFYHGRHKSLMGNIGAQVFTMPCGFADCYPLSSKSHCHYALKSFGNEWGYPKEMVMDQAPEQVGRHTEFAKTLRKHEVTARFSEKNRPEQNPCEKTIGEMRKRWYRTMVMKKVPRRMWDFALKWICEVMQITPNSHFDLDGRTPFEFVTGETPDISEYLDFSYWDFVWFKDNAGLGEVQLGRWCGVAKKIGNSMTYYVLPITGKATACGTVAPLSNIDMQKPQYKAMMAEYDARIEEILKDENHIIHPELDEYGVVRQEWEHLALSDDELFDEAFSAAYNDATVPEAEDEPSYTPDTAGDPYLNVEIALPRAGADSWHYGKVTKRAKGEDGNPIGVASDQPLFDTRTYEVEFPDGHSETMQANTIAECMFAQVDSEGHRHVLLEDIVDHRASTEALSMEDGYMKGRNNKKYPKKTTRGWDVLCQWKDMSTTWVPLKDVKNSHPVELAEYAVANKLTAQPAFAWWVPHVLKKRDSIIGKVKSRYWLKTHKYGIELPKSVEHAIELDKRNKNTLWWQAICDEMATVRKAFVEWEDPVEALPPGYKKTKLHLIFDIKLGESFRRKARLVASEFSPVKKQDTYSSMVTRDSVRIMFLYAALNDLDVMSGDVLGAYLLADNREKCYCIAGPEFGSEQGKTFLIVKALYGLKSAGGSYWSLLREVLHNMGFTPTTADPDVWFRPATKPDGTEIYEYFVTYVDDLLVVSGKAKEVLECLPAT